MENGGWWAITRTRQPNENGKSAEGKAQIIHHRAAIFMWR